MTFPVAQGRIGAVTSAVSQTGTGPKIVRQEQEPSPASSSRCRTGDWLELQIGSDQVLIFCSSVCRQ